MKNISVFLMGRIWNRLSIEVDVLPLGNEEAAGLGLPGRRIKPKVNATANTKDVVKVAMGKNFRFGGKTVRTTEALVA